MKDYENKKKFNSIDSYRRHREQQNTTAPSLEQSKKLLQQKKDSMTEVDSRRIYNILKRDEEIERVNKKWWAHLKQLKNE